MVTFIPLRFFRHKSFAWWRPHLEKSLQWVY